MIWRSKADDLQARIDAFVDRSLLFIRGLPDTPLVRRMAGQLQDAATSVGANYRAARRAKSHADFTAKIGTVSEEADESVYWLTRLLKAEIRSGTGRRIRCSPRPRSLPESSAPLIAPHVIGKVGLTGDR